MLAGTHSNDSLPGVAKASEGGRDVAGAFPAALHGDDITLILWHSCLPATPLAIVMHQWDRQHDAPAVVSGVCLTLWLNPLRSSVRL